VVTGLVRTFSFWTFSQLHDAWLQTRLANLVGFSGEFGPSGLRADCGGNTRRRRLARFMAMPPALLRDTPAAQRTQSYHTARSGPHGRARQPSGRDQSCWVASEASVAPCDIGSGGRSCPAWHLTLSKTSTGQSLGGSLVDGLNGGDSGSGPGKIWGKGGAIDKASVSSSHSRSGILGFRCRGAFFFEAPPRRPTFTATTTTTTTTTKTRKSIHGDESLQTQSVLTTGKARRQHVGRGAPRTAALPVPGLRERNPWSVDCRPSNSPHGACDPLRCRPHLQSPHLGRQSLHR
jgi:hypothetical protein